MSFKNLVAVGRPTGNGWERCEIGNFLIEIAVQSLIDPEVAPFINDVHHIPIQRFPTSCARNELVEVCQQRKADFLMMMDVDGAPKVGTFKVMFNFLRQQETPSVIGVPYCAGDGEIQVFHFGSNQPYMKHLENWEIKRYTRDLAALQTGIKRVAAIGTHCVMFDMRVFQKIEHPYFAYGADEKGIKVTETEDCYVMRHLWMRGVPIYCAWDYPAAHHKELKLLPPVPMTEDMIDPYWMRKAGAAWQDKFDKLNVAPGTNGTPAVNPGPIPAEPQAIVRSQ